MWKLREASLCSLNCIHPWGPLYIRSSSEHMTTALFPLWSCCYLLNQIKMLCCAMPVINATIDNECITITVVGICFCKFQVPRIDLSGSKEASQRNGVWLWELECDIITVNGTKTCRSFTPAPWHLCRAVYSPSTRLPFIPLLCQVLRFPYVWCEEGFAALIDCLCESRCCSSIRCLQ